MFAIFVQIIDFYTYLRRLLPKNFLEIEKKNAIFFLEAGEFSAKI